MSFQICVSTFLFVIWFDFSLCRIVKAMHSCQAATKFPQPKQYPHVQLEEAEAEAGEK
jgi:hypothetical protein